MENPERADNNREKKKKDSGNHPQMLGNPGSPGILHCIA